MIYIKGTPLFAKQMESQRKHEYYCFYQSTCLVFGFKHLDISKMWRVQNSTLYDTYMNLTMHYNYT